MKEKEEVERGGGARLKEEWREVEGAGGGRKEMGLVG